MSLSLAGCTDFGRAKPRNSRDNFVERDFSGKAVNWLADQEGFELAVRLPKFAFEISTEFPAPLAKPAFREIFPAEVLPPSLHPSLRGPVGLCLSRGTRGGVSGAFKST